MSIVEKAGNKARHFLNGKNGSVKSIKKLIKEMDKKWWIKIQRKKTEYYKDKRKEIWIMKKGSKKVKRKRKNLKKNCLRKYMSTKK